VQIEASKEKLSVVPFRESKGRRLAAFAESREKRTQAGRVTFALELAVQGE